MKYLAITACILFAVCIVYTLKPTVSLQQGRVEGFYVNPFENSIASSNVSTFLGIPFAHQPIGDQRFTYVKYPPPTHQGVFNAKQYGYSCPQLDMTGDIKYHVANQSEACLTINIFTPKHVSISKANKQSDTEELLPVLFWIYGGGYIVGTSNARMYNGTKLALERNCVVVTFNYRVSVFGFFAMEELQQEDQPRKSTGNYGINDQQVALQWVKDNIRAFGGDPFKVMIFGQSAGGHAGKLHAVSPYSSGLASSIVIQSGSFTSVLAMDDSKKVGNTIIARLNCSNVANRVACVRSRSTQQVLDAISRPITNGGKCAFLPAIDGSIVPDVPMKLFEQGNFNKVPLMVGQTKDDGGLFGVSLGANNMTKFTYLSMVKLLFKKNNKKVLTMYPLSNYNTPFDAFVDLVTDWAFRCPSRRIAKHVSQYNVPAYLYQWNYKPRTNGVYPRADKLGAYHGAEIPFLFQYQIPKGFGFTTSEVSLSARAMRYWSSFASFGTPKGNVSWPEYSVSQDVNIYLDETISTGIGFGKVEQCDFWEMFPVSSFPASCSHSN